MNGHVIDILGAYLDGELSITRRQKVEAHVSQCETCRFELESLRSLSVLLQTAPAPEFTPTEKFASNLALQLPRQRTAARASSRGSVIWWVIPLVLLAVWLFLQIVFRLSGLAGWLDTGEALAGVAPVAAAEAPHTVWYTAVMDLFGHFLGGSQQTALMVADQLSEFVADTLGQFLWQAAIALAYLVWMAVWWLRRGSRAVKLTESLPR